MVISHKHKFIFIGLPFSASSAITKELCLNYQGEPYLKKHALYHEFQKKASKDELKYFVFAVLRNPMDIVVTSFLKMKANNKGNFTNPRLYQKNGGHIKKAQRKKYNFIKENNATFQQYFLKFYKKPYDNMSSLTLDKCDFIIRHEHIKTDYIKALKLAGIKNPRPLPEENKTIGKKSNLLLYYTKEIKNKAIYIFGPFLKKHQYTFPKEWGEIDVPIYASVCFKLLRKIREINIKWIKNKSTKKSIKGSIYGDLQREN